MGDPLDITSLVFGILAIIFGFLFFPLGGLLGIVAIVLAIVARKKKKSNQSLAGLVTGIVGLVIAIGMGLLIIGLSSYFINSFSALDELSPDAAVASCDEKGEVGYFPCIAFVISEHSNHTMIQSGQICNVEGDFKALTCITIGLEIVNTIEFCNGLENLEYRAYCTAIMMEDPAACAQLPSEFAAQCEQEVISRQLEKKFG